MEDINLDMLKISAVLLRKRASELYSLEDDSELQEFFEPIGGIEQESNFFIIKWPSRCLDTVISINRY